MLKSLLLASCVAAAVVAPARAADPPGHPPIPLLEVTGQAEVGAPPDLATIELGADVARPTAGAAMKDLATITDRITEALRALGYGPEAVGTTQLTLFRNEERDNQGRIRRTVFNASHHLTVRLKRPQFGDIGKILDASTEAGGNYLGEVAFSIEDDNPLSKRGLAEAVRQASGKAEAMASAAGVRLARIHRILEGAPAREPGPIAPRMMAFAGSAPAPVVPGTLRRTYTVTLEYEILSP